MRNPSDPSAWWGAVGALVGAIITLLVAFGVELTPDQQAAILGVVAAAGPLVVAYLIGRTAWRPTNVDTVVEGAYWKGRHSHPDETGAPPDAEELLEHERRVGNITT